MIVHKQCGTFVSCASEPDEETKERYKDLLCNELTKSIRASAFIEKRDDGKYTLGIKIGVFRHDVSTELPHELKEGITPEPLDIKEE